MNEKEPFAPRETGESRAELHESQARVEEFEGIRAEQATNSHHDQAQLKQNAAGPERPLNEEARTRQALLYILEDVEDNRRRIEQAHREWLQSVDALRDPVLVHDAEFRVLRCNRAYAAHAGMEFRDIVGKPYWECFPKRAGPLPNCGGVESAAGHDAVARTQGQEFTLATGEAFVSRAFGIVAPSGRYVQELHIFEDVTERKRAEVELRRLNWALDALGQSNSALVHAGTENELFQSCCDAIAGTEGYPLAWIGLSRNDAAHSIEIAAAAGTASQFVQNFAMSWADEPLGQDPAGTAIRTGVTQVANTLAASDMQLPWSKRARAHGLASVIALPLRTDGEIAGTLVVCSREPGAFGQPEVDLFQELAADIGYGIASRRTRMAYEASLLEREQTTRKLRAAFESLIAVLAATVERRDPYTAGHQRRVAELVSAIAHTLGLEPARTEGLHFAATIHDIGKIYVPAEILARPGKLPPVELDLIKSHAQVGFEIVKDVEFPWQVADMIRQHHERLDGSGYPQGLKGDEILFDSRILAVADVVEAMSSHRPYRAGLGLDAALAEIRRQAGTKLDLQVVAACERVFREMGFSFGKE